MGYQEIKSSEMLRAKGYIYELAMTDDPAFVGRKPDRPITDLRQMFLSSVELYGDNVAFMQKFKKERHIQRLHTDRPWQTSTDLEHQWQSLELQERELLS